MNEPARLSFDSTDAFLAWEREQPLRHEFVDGAVRAMVGAALRHNTLVFNLRRAVGDGLRGGPCRAFQESVKVLAGRNVFYPDIAVTCSPVAHDSDIVPEPVLIAEVLSPSTERYDRGRKLHAYETIPSLRAYLLLSQEAVALDLFVREAEGWLHRVFVGAETVVALPVADLKLRLGDLYDDVLAA